MLGPIRCSTAKLLPQIRHTRGLSIQNARAFVQTRSPALVIPRLSQRGFASDDGLEEKRAQIAELRDQLEALETKRKDIKRDINQAKTRHVGDLEKETKYGITKFAKEMLKVSDNLDRAATSVKQEDLDQDRELRKLHAGIVRLKTVVADALQDFGVEEMEVMDAVFDPSKHEAMFMVPMPGKKSNHIFHVMEPGYVIHDRTLRAAKVGVAS